MDLAKPAIRLAGTRLPGNCVRCPDAPAVCGSKMGLMRGSEKSPSRIAAVATVVVRPCGILMR